MRSHSKSRPQGRSQKGKNLQKTASKKIKSFTLESIKQSGGKPWEEQVRLLHRGEHCACMKELIALIMEFHESGRTAELQGLWFRCKGGHANHHLPPNHHFALAVVWERKWIIEIREVHDSYVHENLFLPVFKSA